MTEYRRIVLNPGRAYQIERLAALRSTSLAGAVEELVADRVKAGEIEPGFPACRVERQGAHVVVVLDGKKLAPIALTAAAQFGEHLELLANKSTGSASVDLPDGTTLTARRSGHGVTIAAGSARATFSDSMCREIATQIMETAR